MKNEIGEKTTQISTVINQESILYSPDIVQHERDGVCLLVDPASPNWASVNPLGSSIVRRCDGHRTMGEVVEWAKLEYGLPEAAIIDFIGSASRSGFISQAPDLSPGYPGRSRVISPSTLEELWIYTNGTCPLKCRHCLVDGGTGSPEMMSSGEIKQLVDDAVSLGVERIYFTGGEPFLRKDLIELAEYVTARVQLVILTCGVLINDEISRKLAGLSRGNLILQVSLEGPDAPTNDAIRGEGSFDRALSGIHSLLGAGMVPIVTTTLTRLNYLKAPETTRFLAGLGIRDHHVLWLHQCGRAREGTDELLLSGQEISRTMDRMREAARESGIVLDNFESLAVRTKGRGHKNDLCNSCYGVLAVNTDAHIYPCASVVGTPEFDCGSVRENPLRNIWLESPGAIRIRENSVQKKSGCNTCYLKFFCGGGCFAQAYFSNEATTGAGCIMAPDPYCEVYRSKLLNIMWESAAPGAEEINNDLPLIYRVMEKKLPGCASSAYDTLDAAHDVGTYHCSCVLAMDVSKDSGGS